MAVSSLGVGSGLALNDLVSQLLQAERQPKEARPGPAGPGNLSGDGRE